MRRILYWTGVEDMSLCQLVLEYSKEGLKVNLFNKRDIQVLEVDDIKVVMYHISQDRLVFLPSPRYRTALLASKFVIYEGHHTLIHQNGAKLELYRPHVETIDLAQEFVPQRDVILVFRAIE